LALAGAREGKKEITTKNGKGGDLQKREKNQLSDLEGGGRLFLPSKKKKGRDDRGWEKGEK